MVIGQDEPIVGLVPEDGPTTGSHAVDGPTDFSNGEVQPGKHPKPSTRTTYKYFQGNGHTFYFHWCFLQMGLSVLPK